MELRQIYTDNTSNHIKIGLTCNPLLTAGPRDQTNVNLMVLLSEYVIMTEQLYFGILDLNCIYSGAPRLYTTYIYMLFAWYHIYAKKYILGNKSKKEYIWSLQFKHFINLIAHYLLH